jgi:hypothetical protein
MDLRVHCSPNPLSVNSTQAHFPQSNGCWPESCGRFWERNDDFLESNGWFLTVGRFQRPGRHSKRNLKKNLKKGKVFRRATRRVDRRAVTGEP